MAKAAVGGCEAIVAEMVAQVKERKSALEKQAKYEGKKDKEVTLSKEQVRALLAEAWDSISTHRLVDAAIAEAAAELGL